jgi:hypothetical protein
MFNFTEIFPTPSKPHRQVKILNDIVVRLADGTTRHCSAGETVEVTHEAAKGLDPSDIAFIGTIDREPIQITKSPERPDPAPLPEAWQKLPKCFSDWWALNEKFRVAAIHRRLITEARISVFGTASSLNNPSENVGTILGFELAESKRGHNTVVTKREIRLDDPAVQQQEREFLQAEFAALDHMKDLSHTYGLTLQKLHLACGQARLDSVEALSAITQEVRSIGFELFSKRVQALELHPQQVARLYAGSALFMKFAVHHDPSVSGTCSAGYDPSGNIRIYVDADVSEIAGGMLSDIDRTAELAPLLAEARKELTKAQKLAA